MQAHYSGFPYRNQNTKLMKLLNRLWRRVLIGILVFFAVVALARLIQVAAGNFYSGVRTPYIQEMASDRVVLRWQTEQAEQGVVRFGAHIPFENEVSERRSRKEHEVVLTGLQAGTHYFYQIGPDNNVLYGGSDYWFDTAPIVGGESARIWVLGDPGYANPVQDHVRDAMLNWVEQHPRPGKAAADLILTTGDNAYSSGTNKQYQHGFFTPYGKLFRNIPVWPAYGNHDSRRWAFFKVFTLPEQGESGGVASGTEHYYSFDYANMHVVMLDSQDSSLRESGAMMTWLKQDLAANTRTWVITVFHHPPYTHGSHNSDDPKDSGGRMRDMREHFLPVLEAAGVDLVMSGHSHMYERSGLMKCHYGFSNTLKPSMILQAAKGLDSYQKHSQHAGAYEGTVYAVVGSSEKVDDGPLDHPAMTVARHEAGSLMIDVNGNSLTGEFINQDQKVTDRFTIQKGVESAPLGRPCDKL